MTPSPAPSDTPPEGDTDPLPRDDVRPELSLEALRRVHQHNAAESEAQRRCGRDPIPMDDPALYRGGESGRYWFQGLKVCGNVWSCPVCADRICRKRGHDLQQLVDACEERGGAVYLLTLTLPHHAGHRLEAVVTALVESFRYLMGGGAWKRRKEDCGLVGMASGLDATHGRNGWHPHRHVVLFFERPMAHDTRDELLAWLRDRWARVVYSWKADDRGRLVRACAWRPDDDPPENDEGEPVRESLRGQPDPPHDFPQDHTPAFGIPRRDVGVQLQRGEKAGEYVAKLGLGKEAVAMPVKRGRRGHRTPLQILADYARNGRQLDLFLWKTWCDTMAGRQHLNVTPGLAEEMEREEQTALELDDQEAAEAHPEPEPELVALVDRHLWRLLDAELRGGAQEFVRMMATIHDGDLRELGREIQATIRGGADPPAGHVRTDAESRRVWWFGAVE